MAEITASLVKDLREQTGVGMMDCKRALNETNGNFDEAIKYLREKGLAKAANKADRETKEGRIFTAINSSAKKGVIVEVNCETDFVGKNDTFLAFGATIADLILNNSQIKTLEDLDNVTLEGKNMKEYISGLVLKVGENIGIKKFDIIEADGRVANYTHSNGKVAVLIGFSGNIDELVAKDITMHIAAMNPLYLVREEVPASELETEKEIAKQQLLNEGKPAAVVEKIVEGKINKYYKEICLIEQEFVKDPKKAIKDIIPAGCKAERFIRYSFN